MDCEMLILASVMWLRIEDPSSSRARVERSGVWRVEATKENRSKFASENHFGAPSEAGEMRLVGARYTNLSAGNGEFGNRNKGSAVV